MSETQRQRFIQIVVSVGLCLLLMLIASACSSASPATTATPIVTPEPMIAPLASEDDFCPPPRGWFAYTVQAGDTLAELADQTGSTISELAAANCLNNPRGLTAGMVIYVPRRMSLGRLVGA